MPSPDTESSLRGGKQTISDTDAFLRLACIPGLGPLSAARLLSYVSKPADIFRLSMAQLQQVEGIGPERARNICDPRFIEVAEKERARSAQLGIRILTRADENYPTEFLRLNDAPLAIWIKGELRAEDQVALAIVGPRTPSAYGHRQAKRFAGSLARSGCCIISGLARGVDTVAHQAALDADGRTIAVIGSGFEQLYPSENESLAKEIADGKGAIISEFPLDARPAPGNFPRRNRLVAALSLGVLVIEASARSGALITARLAGEMGRDVLALPGPIDRPEAAGSNALIRDGASCITSVDDIYDEVGSLKPLHEIHQRESVKERTPIKLNPRERDLYTLLGDDPRSVDELIRISNLPASAVSATMVTLEVRRMAKKVPGGYIRAC